MEALFVYKYEYEGKELFAVQELMRGYIYELANLRDIGKGEKWGDIIIVSEGVYFYNDQTQTYMKIEYLVKEAKKNIKTIADPAAWEEWENGLCPECQSNDLTEQEICEMYLCTNCSHFFHIEDMIFNEPKKKETSTDEKIN